MRRRLHFPVTTVLALMVLALLGANAVAAAPAWTTYRHDAARSGIDPDSTAPVTPAQSWQTPALDGQVYGQPLVYGSYVFVATENDTIYKLDAGTGAVVWSRHLATPEPSSVAPCGDISPSIGITGTPIIDTAAKRIYAVGSVSVSGAVQHQLFALDLGSGQPAPGFPVTVDPPYPSGGSAVNQLQRAGLALDGGRVLISYGGNDGDCNTYWGWVVSAPTDGSRGLASFQVDASYHEGAVWAAGNAPAIDAAGNAFVATGNGTSNNSAKPDYGNSVVKLNSLASPLDYWAPTNWQTLDSSDADLGSSMPTLLPAGYIFESGKDGNGYLLNGASLGHVSAPVAQASGFCSGGSFGGSVYDAANATIYAACNSGLKALTLGSGSPRSLASKSGFSAPSGASGPPMIAGGLVWVTNHSTRTLYGLDLGSGTTRTHLSIPENVSGAGSAVNHFASPSAGGGRLFVGSGDQVTAYTIGALTAQSTATNLTSSANPADAGTAVSLTAAVAPAPDGGTVTFTDGGAPISGCVGVAGAFSTSDQAVCHTSFGQPGTHVLSAHYTGTSFYGASTAAALAESVRGPAPRLSGLRVSPHRVLIAGRKIGGRCVKPTRRNQSHKRCRRSVRLTVTYTVNTAATVILTIKRQVVGRRAKGQCVPQTRKNRHRARCPRWVPVRGSIKLAAGTGVNRFKFTGRIGGRKLGPGAYRLTATPTANGQTGRRHTATFKAVG